MVAAFITVANVVPGAMPPPLLLRGEYRPPVRSSRTLSARHLPLKDIQKRCRFAIPQPSHLPTGYRLSDSRIAWIVRDASFPRLPSRQAVCLTYIDASGHTLRLLMAHRVSGADSHDNANQTLKGAYFVTDIPARSQLIYGTQRGVDYVIVAADLSLTELHRVEASL